MAGKAGRSGRKAISAHEHWLRGTESHGPKPNTPSSPPYGDGFDEFDGSPVNADPAPAAAPVSSPPPPLPEALVAGLGAEGRLFVTQFWMAHHMDAPDWQMLLRLAGQALDDAVAYRAIVKAQGAEVHGKRGGLHANPHLAMERRAVQQFQRLLDSLARVH